MTRLVQLTTYPLRQPRHGGQLRCAAIRSLYRQAGIEVETIALLHGGDYHPSGHERNDIVLPADHAGYDPLLPRFTDSQGGRILAGDAATWQRFADLLDRFAPDIIQLEQPWLYPGVRRWLQERAPAVRPRLVYSSQNIEWKLKRDEGPHGGADAQAYLAEVARAEALERELARSADLVVACTAEEEAELRSMAGTGAPGRFVTAHNAIAPFTPDPARIAALKERHGLDRYPLFIGSAHPPNVDGFWRMLAPSLAFLRPGERIVVAGGVGHLLRQHRGYAGWSGINEPRLLLLGEVERADLDALLGGASVVLLPITTGGGSNLKTAEAIYSGRPVLATPHALRGYGDAGRWPTIRVADDADAFRRVLRSLLDATPEPLPAGYDAIRSQVTWDVALAPLVAAIGAWITPAPQMPRH